MRIVRQGKPWRYTARKMKIAIYPGTFDPVTRGHMDVLDEAARLFDKVVVGVGINPRKVALFSDEERVQMLRGAISEGGWENVEAACFSGLTVDFAKRHGALFIVRGLRAVTDFEQLSEEIKTVFLIPSHRHLYLSSSIVRQAAELGGQIIKGSVPDCVAVKLKEKFGF